MFNARMILVWVWLAMVALSFVEAYVEGRHPWNRRKVGWKLRLGKANNTKWKKVVDDSIMIKPAETHIFSGYHFFLFVIELPILISLPLIIYGWNFELFGILVSAYFSGMVIEDFVYFLVNPAIKFSNWNERFVSFFSWVRVGNFKVPINYITGILIALLSWYFIWR